LIVDNASIHTSNHVRDILYRVLDHWGIKLAYLPTYSPELNPVELVFSLAKRYIRHSPHRYNTLTFADLVQEAFSQVTNEKIQGFYHHCIHSTTPLDQQEFCNFT